MARIRSIHPAIWTDENFVSVSAAARLFFIGVWGEADDNGIFEWKPLVLKARLFPVDNVVIPDLLQELVDVGFVRQFEMQGKKLGAIKNFCKHQRPKAPKSFWDFPSDIQVFIAASSREDDPEMALKKRLLIKSGGSCTYCRTQIVAASKRHNSMEIDHDIPVSRGGTDDEDNLVASCRSCNRTKYTRTGAEYVRFLCDRIATSAAPNATSEVASQMEDVGCRMKDVETSAAVASDAGTSAAPADDGWPKDYRDRFWSVYPNKVGKGDALAKLDRIRKGRRVSFDKLMSGLDAYIASKPPDRQWCNPATWLNQGRWDDEPSIAAPQRTAWPDQRQHELAGAFDRLKDHAQRMEDAHSSSPGWGRQ